MGIQLKSHSAKNVMRKSPDLSSLILGFGFTCNCRLNLRMFERTAASWVFLWKTYWCKYCAIQVHRYWRLETIFPSFTCSSFQNSSATKKMFFSHPISLKINVFMLIRVDPGRTLLPSYIRRHLPVNSRGIIQTFRWEPRLDPSEIESLLEISSWTSWMQMP